MKRSEPKERARMQDLPARPPNRDLTPAELDQLREQDRLEEQKFQSENNNNE